ncbi:MAG TPA: hypothetical protein VGO22_13775 [Pseudorhizobium sp.]|jgi:hypothetical protein|nr:hypothetical protein [Pseudorhizobium sp.]
MVDDHVQRLGFDSVEMVMIRHAATRIGCSVPDFMRSAVIAVASDICTVDGLPAPEFVASLEQTSCG